jgi:hypothetical protein
MIKHQNYYTNNPKVLPLPHTKINQMKYSHEPSFETMQNEEDYLNKREYNNSAAKVKLIDKLSK